MLRPSGRQSRRRAEQFYDNLHRLQWPDLLGPARVLHAGQAVNGTGPEETKRLTSGPGEYTGALGGNVPLGLLGIQTLGRPFPDPGTSPLDTGGGGAGGGASGATLNGPAAVTWTNA